MSTVENAALLALVALLPLVVLTLTSFVKVSVVLSLARNAIGATDAPSGLVITGLSLVLTFFVMAPVATSMVQAASAPVAPAPGPAQPGPAQPGRAQPDPAQPATGQPGAVQTTQTTQTVQTTQALQTTQTAQPTQTVQTTQTVTGQTGSAQSDSTPVDVLLKTLVPAQYQSQVAAAERAIGPLRSFLVKHTREADRETFRELAATLGNDVRGDEVWVLAPAFIATELREAFMIAILIFVPFLVIDLVVALSLAALGLASTPPQSIALPLKLVLFVAVDGWRLLLDGLLRGYA